MALVSSTTQLSILVFICAVGIDGMKIQNPNKNLEAVIERETCDNDVCGPNADCREVGTRPVCYCLPGFLGEPPNCHGECVVNQDCLPNEACTNKKCVDPCSGACGTNAECQDLNRIPVCTCIPGFTGDPFVRCIKIPLRPLDPCAGDPCGPNADCREVGTRPVCYCLPGFLGAPPNCHRECDVNQGKCCNSPQDCLPNEACTNKKCVDPCPGACGTNAECQVLNRIPVCTCISGFTGDPFVRCINIPLRPLNPCAGDTCGTNAECSVINNRANCKCIQGYIGNPYVRCHPKCVINSECPQYLACVNQTCIDPCPGTCAVNAYCNVVNHKPQCTCTRGFQGDPYSSCEPMNIPTDSCNPDPCGKYTNCRVVADSAVCSCKPGFFGNPNIGCYADCIINSDCPMSQACISKQCIDPCPGSCGNRAECSVVSHTPVCSCPTGFVGDPFIGC